jgi:hypothetical protein
MERFTDAIRRRQAADSLLSIADRVAAAGIEPMSTEEIDAEVKTVRAERRQRAGGHNTVMRNAEVAAARVRSWR